jgi:hypothetical protein
MTISVAASGSGSALESRRCRTGRPARVAGWARSCLARAIAIHDFVHLGHERLPLLGLQRVSSHCALLIAYLFRTINAVRAAPLATELGLGADDLGLLTSVYFVTFAAAQIPIGILLANSPKNGGYAPI